jgi:hypothetical protein
MHLSDYLGILGIIIGAAGLLYAKYQGAERRKLQEYVRSQNWHLYSKANNSNGSTQRALTKYKEKTADRVDIEVLEWLAKADAFGQDVFKDVIRQIQIAEPRFDQETIRRWVSEGRIAETHAAFFRNLAPTDEVIKQTGQSPTG